MGVEGGTIIPAIGELVTVVLEVAVAHVVDTKDEAMLILRDALAYVLEKLLLLLACLLGHLREVVDLGTF